jgi:superfamily II DNA helicase RecQ
LAFGQLRAFLPNVPLVALTATADKVVKNNLNKALFMQHPLRINMSPNKDNIRISVTKIDSLSRFNWWRKGRQLHLPLSFAIHCMTLHIC